MAFTTKLPPQNYIDGQWVDPASGESIEMICPSDGHVIGKIARGNAKDIEIAVAAARRAFEGEWGRTTAMGLLETATFLRNCRSQTYLTPWASH